MCVCVCHKTSLCVFSVTTHIHIVTPVLCGCCPVCLCCPLQEEEIQKAIFVGNYDGAVDTCLKAGRLADALLIANIGGAELFKKTMQRYMRRNPRPYMAVGVACRVRALVRAQPPLGTVLAAHVLRPCSTHTCVILDTAVLGGLLARYFCTHACGEAVSLCCVCRACRSSLPWLTVITCRWSRHVPWGSGVRHSLCWQHTQVRSGIRSVALLQPPMPFRCVAAARASRLLGDDCGCVTLLQPPSLSPVLALPCCLLVC